MGSFLDGFGGVQGDVPEDKLTPEQQEIRQRFVARIEELKTHYATEGVLDKEIHDSCQEVEEHRPMDGIFNDKVVTYWVAMMEKVFPHELLALAEMFGRGSDMMGNVASATLVLLWHMYLEGRLSAQQEARRNAQEMKDLDSFTSFINGLDLGDLQA